MPTNRNLLTKSRDPINAPAITSPCPFKYLVSECSTTSVPSANGFCKYGVQ